MPTVMAVVSFGFVSESLACDFGSVEAVLGPAAIG